jgi:CheY-like chemotaxis protein
MADPTFTRESPARRLRFQDFHDLSQQRIEHILLVSSLYDSFILAEDGQLNELILKEFLHLNIRHIPSLTRVSSGTEAVAMARERGQETLIITSMHVGDMNALTLARLVREAGLGTPVVPLAHDSRELDEFVRRYDVSDLDRIFLWQGDVRILLAIVKYIEDRMNVAHDTGLMGVQAIIVVEDNIRFYSSYLPAIYAELMLHSHRLVPEGVNLSHKLLRVQARPKILLCDTFEDAWEYFSTYRENILGVIADVEFFKGGELYAGAGVELARRVRESQPDVPIMLQSSVAENEAVAASVGASFLLKDSPLVLNQLRRFMIDHFGFGDFIFRMPDGREIGRASDMKSLEEHLRTVPAESVAYHAERNHFSKRLKARTEFALAHSLRPRKVSDFVTPRGPARRPDPVHPRYRQGRQRAVVADFDRAAYDPSTGFSRIGGGSLGGKARGLAFVNRLLDQADMRERFEGVEIAVPPSVVLATDVFDAFLAENDLSDFAIRCDDEAELLGLLRQVADQSRRSSSLSAATYAGRALVEPARGLAVPAVRRHLRDLHAAQQRSGPGGPVRAAAGGHRASVRLDVLGARQGIPENDAVPPGGGKDGRDPPEGGGRHARAAFLPGPRRRGAIAQLLPCSAAGGGRRRSGSRARPGRHGRQRGAVRAVLSPLSEACRRVLVGAIDASELAARVLRARSRGGKRGCGQPERDHAGEVRARRGGGRRNAQHAGLDVLAGRRCRVRRPVAPGRPPGHVRAGPQARPVPPRGHPERSARGRQGGHGRAGGD